MYPKGDPVASPAVQANTIQALEESMDHFKLIMKKQVLLLIRKFKLGFEIEEICYNI